MSEPAVTGEPLSNFQPGQRGRIVLINLPGLARSRVMEMGLTIGSTVEVVRYAPLGDPVELKVRGSHISLRKAEAGGIQAQRL